MALVCGEANEAVWGDLLFAWRTAKHVASNAIVLARISRRWGSAADRRAASTRYGSLSRRRGSGHDLSGAVLASDAFIPFADGPQVALEAGVTAIIQLGGTKRDEEVVAAVEAAGGAMVFYRPPPLPATGAGLGFRPMPASTPRRSSSSARRRSCGSRSSRRRAGRSCSRSSST